MNKLILLILVVLVSVVSILFQSQTRDYVYEKIVGMPSMYQGSLFLLDYFKGVDRLAQERDTAMMEVDELRAALTDLSDMVDENNMMRRAMGLGLRQDLDLAMGGIVFVNLEEGVLTLDVGREDGVMEGDNVIGVFKEVIGYVEEVNEGSSRVRIATSPKFMFAARVGNNSSIVQIRGDGTNMVLGLVPIGDEIVEGDLIVTSGAGEIFIDGLVVGRVGKISSSDVSPYKEAEVISSIDILGIKNVFVVTGY